MKTRDLIGHWDFLLAILGTALLYWAFPSVPSTFAKDLYSVGISVLAIVFAVFFASLAIIISSSDDQFVIFLETHGLYQRLIATYSFTLWLLFAGLIFALAAYALTSGGARDDMQSPYAFFLFVFLTLYALFATVSSTRDSIKWAVRRAQFLRWKQSKDDEIGRKQ